MAKSFRDEMLSEAVEAIAHEAVAGEIRAAAATPGMTDKDIAARVIGAMANPRGPVMVLARTLPGFSFPLAGTALAHLLGRTRFLDKVLPEMNTPAVRAAREILRQAGPNILIGALAGVRDAAQDIDRGQIQSQLDAVRSDPTTPSDQRDRQLDWVLVSRLLPGRIFCPARNDNRTVRFDANGVPVVLDPDWQTMRGMWDETHKASTRKEGGGKKGQPATTTVTPAEAFPFDWVRLEDLATTASVVITPEDMKTIKGLLAKPAEWWEQVGADVRQFFIILGRSLRSDSALQYGLREDHIKDVVGVASPIFLQDMAREYLPQAPHGRFPPEVVQDIVDTFDAALGSELTTTNKVKAAIARAWSSRGRLPGMAKAALGTVAFLGLLFVFAQIALFLTAFAGVVYGALMSYEGMARLPFTSAVFEANWLAAGLMGAGGVTIIILLYTLKIWQRVFAPIVSWFGASADFLENYRWHFTYMMLPAFLFAIGALFFETSIYARALVLAIACARVAVGHGFRIAEDPENSRLITWRSSKYGIPVILGVFVLDYFIRMAWVGIGWAALVTAATSTWSFVTSKHVVAIALRFAAAIAAAMLLVNFLERRYDGRSGNTTYYSRKTSVAARILATAMVILIMFYPWIRMPTQPWEPFSSPAKVSASASPSHPTTGHGTMRHDTGADDGFDCSGLNPEQRRLAGCP